MANSRRGFLMRGASAFAVTVGNCGPMLAAFNWNTGDQEAQPMAADWMSQWMLSPQHGAKKLRGPGQGMLILGRFADPMYFVEEPLSWKPDQGQAGSPAFTVPKGFVTDLASIPAVFWSVLRPDGEYAYAAILHDYLYWVQTCSKDQADETLRSCMEDFQVPKVKIEAIYRAVHDFGMHAWNENANLKAGGESRFLKDYPSSPVVRWSTWRQDRSHFDPNPA